MSQPTLQEAREASEWRPELGVLSVYLGFDPADRAGAWRTELRNGLEAVLDAHREAEHERRLALRATAKRVLDRFEDGDLRPPPRGEVGFVEVAEKEGGERWWGTGTAPVADACVEFGPRAGGRAAAGALLPRRRPRGRPALLRAGAAAALRRRRPR